MPSDVTLLAMGTITTTTRVVPANTIPVEDPTEGTSATLDLASGTEERVLNATVNVGWDLTVKRGVLDCWIEASPDQIAWREVRRFKRVEAAAQNGGLTGIAMDSVGGAMDRYVRVRYRVAPSSYDAGFATRQCAVRFGVAGRRT